MHEPFICSRPLPCGAASAPSPVSGESLAGEVGPPDLAKDQQRGTRAQLARTQPGFALSCLGGGWWLFLAVPGEQAQASPSRGARSMACTGPTGRSSLATVLPPVTPPPQTQVPAQDDTGQGCGDSRLSPGHRDAGRLVTLQLRASESWHHKTEGRPVPSLTPPPAGSQGALPVKGFSRHADIYKCLILAA